MYEQAEMLILQSCYISIIYSDLFLLTILVLLL